MNTKKNDKILGELIGLARACENNPKTKHTDAVITDGLAACIAEHHISDEYFEKILGTIQNEKNAVSPGCAVCASPCGNTAPYDMERIWNGENTEIKRQILDKICRIAADVRQGSISADEQKQYIELFYKALPMVSYGLEAEAYLSVLSEFQTISGGMI